MNVNTLCKAERMRSRMMIEKLFSGQSQSFSVYPLRVVFMPLEAETDCCVTILISVSKRKFKHAVKRNRIKRQIREAYRKNKHELICKLGEQNKALAVAFIYVADELKTSRELEDKMKTALARIGEKADI